MRWNSSPAARKRRGLSQLAARIAATLLIANCAWLQLAHAADGTAIAPPTGGDTQPADASTDDSVGGLSPGSQLTEKSTLLQWKVASASERSRLAVSMAREQLPAAATKLELATAAMEITNCLTATAKDPRLAAWTLAPTAKTCLTAPERPAK